MSARRLPRELGVVIVCNGDDCESRVQTANVYVKVNRKHAQGAGWIGGGAKRHKRWDFCPACAPAEVALIAKEAKEKEERKVARAAAKKARMDASTPLVRKSRRKPSQEASAEA